MIVIQGHAEDRINDLLPLFTGNAGRCMWIKSTAAKVCTNFSGLIEDVTGVSDGYIITCDDGDIFVLANGISGRAFSAVMERLGVDEKDMAVFEVKRDQQRILAMADLKREIREGAKRLKEKEDRLREKEERRDTILNTPFNTVLLATLARRRSERKAITVLLVEDEMFTRHLVATTLGASFNVVAAESGEEALNHYLHEAPDVVFLDIGLPDVSGHDVLARLLQMDRDAHVVMLSGNGNHENVMRAIQAGAKGFVVKPFTREKLVQSIGKCPKMEALKTGG